MGESTKIQWTAHTFNPWIGCTRVSPGCDHCYAEHLMDRWLGRVKWGPGQPRKRTSAANWREPLRWNAKAEREGRRYRVFCASLADVFDNEVPDEWRRDLFNLILSTPSLDWLLLTKRIGNAARMIDEALPDSMKAMPPDCPMAWPWPNVWLGATVCNQEEADRDIPKLLATPAAVRFLSIEPILDEIDLSHWLSANALNEIDGGPCVDWVIIGGESGPRARATNVEWIRSIVQQCQAAQVPVFVKQLGARAETTDMFDLPVTWAPDMGEPITLDLRDYKGGDPDEWPEDLRIREFPA